MKKTLSIIMLASISSSVLAASEFTPFTTLERAQQHCPAANALIFTASHPTLPNSKGTVSGNNRVSFTSIPVNSAAKPQQVNQRNVIANVQFRNTDGIYGYLSNNMITCLYDYPTFLNT